MSMDILNTYAYEHIDWFSFTKHCYIDSTEKRFNNKHVDNMYENN